MSYRLPPGIVVIPLLQPSLQLLHALVVPGEVLLLHVLGHLEAVHGVDRRVQKAVVLSISNAIPEVVDVPGIHEGPLEPPGRQLGKVRMHLNHSL